MGSHHRGNKKEVRALDSFIKLMRASDTVTADLNRNLSSYGLSHSQFGALETLYHLGPLRSCQLAQKLLRTSGNVTLVLDNLEKRGLISRERENTDRRVVTVSLTDEGRRLIEEIYPEHSGYIVAQMNHLTTHEQEQLGILCRKLGLAVQGTPAEDQQTSDS